MSRMPEWNYIVLNALREAILDRGAICMPSPIMLKENVVIAKFKGHDQFKILISFRAWILKEMAPVAEAYCRPCRLTTRRQSQCGRLSRSKHQPWVRVKATGRSHGDKINKAGRAELNNAGKYNDKRRLKRDVKKRNQSGIVMLKILTCGDDEASVAGGRRKRRRRPAKKNVEFYAVRLATSYRNSAAS